MCNRFAMFPHHLLRAGLTLREQSVLLCLLSYRNGDGQAWPSRAVISRDTGIHIPHIYQAVKSLVQRGVITMNVQPGVRTVYTFPCLDAQPAETPAPAPAPEPVREPAPAPVVAKNARAAAPASVATPEPTPAQPTDDNLSRVAEQVPVSEPVAVATPQQQAEPVQPPAPVPQPKPAQPVTPVASPAPDPVAKPQPEPAPAPVSVAPMPALEPLPPTPAQQPVQQPAPAPVAAPMPALEPAPPAPRRNIVSARVARLPDVDEAVRREVDARPIIRTPKPAGVDDVLWDKCQRLQALCAENTARSREQKAAAQRFDDGVTAATEQVAKQIAAQDIAAARQRAAQDAAAAKTEQQAAQDAAPPTPAVTDQKPDEQPAAEKTTNRQNADAARDSAVRDGCYPAGEKTNSPEPVATDTAATAPIVLPAPIVAQEPQPPAATPQQGELLPAPAKQSQGVKTVAVQGELLPEPPKKKRGGSKSVGHRIPDDWYLTRKLGMWAKEKYGLDDDTIRDETDKFIDHWTASANANAWKCDWDAAWRSWIRKHAESGGTANGNRYNNQPQQKSKMMQVIESFAKKYDGDFGIPF